MSHLVPPKDPAKRRRYYALKALMRKAPPHQKLKLQAIARGLMERTDGERLPGRGRPP